MNIFVCIRQVPDTTTRIKLREDGNGIDEADIQWIISPHDELAIEEALQLRDRQPGSTVTVLSAGPERVTESLRMALAMGADSAVRLDLPGDADSATNARALAAAIGKLGQADVVRRPLRGSVVAGAGRDEVLGQALAALGVFLDNPCLVDGQCQRLSHAGIVERFFRGIEAHEITAEIIELVKAGPGAERVQQFGGDEALVPNHVGLPGFKQVDRGGRGFDRKKIDDTVFRIRSVPVVFVFA